MKTTRSLSALTVLALMFASTFAGAVTDPENPVRQAMTAAHNMTVYSAPDGSMVSGIRCGTPSPTSEQRERYRQLLGRYRQEGFPARRGVVTIPVAFHVVRHDDGSADVTDQQIQDQLQVLNDAFNTAGFLFTHHSTDRIDNTLWSTQASDASVELQMKNALAIDPAHTLNLYICDLEDGLLGYSYLPDSFAEDDIRHGVVVLTWSLPGGGAYPYDEGETATHEIGHYLGLLHTFEGGCIPPGDEVDDTPYEQSPAYGCPTGRDSCPSQPGTDPIHNFMDYSDDACMYEFTSAQIDRMHLMAANYKPTLYGGVRVDLKVNGQDGPLPLAMWSPLDVTLSIAPGDQQGVEYECWIAVLAPTKSVLRPVGVLPLPAVQDFRLFHFNYLPKGIYTFAVVLDAQVNGVLDRTYLDHAVVGYGFGANGREFFPELERERVQGWIGELTSAGRESRD